MILLILCSTLLTAQSGRNVTLLDDGSAPNVWSAFQSLGVTVRHQGDEGAVRFDVDFTKGSGYGGIVRNFDLPLPENYELSFMMKATVPVNNFEVKVSGDSIGENIWWVNNKGYTYPTEWKRIVIKKRHLGYAWGTKYAPHAPKLARLEIVVTAGTGGKGSVWIDDVQLTTVPVPPSVLPQPAVTASSNKKDQKSLQSVLPGAAGAWRSAGAKDEWLQLDLKYEKEFGAVELEWDASLGSLTYDLLRSYDGVRWEPLYSVVQGIGGHVVHFTPESDARFIRLVMKSNAAKRPFILHSIALIGSGELSTPNQYYERLAAIAPKGWYPRYFLKQQPYWTVVGVPSDTREALFGEDGAFETDRQHFSLEPFITLSGGKQLLHWENAVTEQSLLEGYLPVPTVTRTYPNITLTTTLLASGEPERSFVMARYTIRNRSAVRQSGAFYLALRPFQVNPTSQWLNYDGGFAATPEIAFSGTKATVGSKNVIVSGAPAGAGVVGVDQGDIIDHIAQDKLPAATSARQERGMTSGAFRYTFDLAPGDSMVIIAAVPFLATGDRWTDRQPTPEEFAAVLADVAGYWKRRLTTVGFTVNAEAQRYVDLIRTNLAYILINKDKNGFQPGSRSYERSWIRDGSMTSDALLKLGITEEPKKYLEWYSGYQYESGAVPCVVDTRGPDPVPEHDSHGQLIFGIMEYFRFTGDTAFLRARWDNITAAIGYIQSLRAQRMTPEYRDGNNEKRAYYGLVTESISHEGYSDKAMHSYWDNFFVLKGMKDAAAAAAVLGKKKEAAWYDSLARSFRTDLYASIALAMTNRSVNYIPGCVEKGDFDATSTSIAMFPNGEMRHVPQPAFNNTFDKYYSWFVERAEGKLTWDAYTPYEVRNIGTFVYLGQKERAHYALEYFMKDQRPSGWNHWAEVVANGYRTVRFIGDMPHTWVGSDYINAIRAMFVYEIDDDHSLVLGAGLKDSWVKEGLAVKDLPTHYGTLNYSIAPASGGTSALSITGSIDAAKTPVLVPVSLQSTPLKRASVNGVMVQPVNGFIPVRALPARVELTY
ncbi:MAG: discoidin domain-containing protein [Bacteroidetes bacterium]|nr:discoidin domain-containing protein [Bacteroidota bacterium]